MDPYAVIVASCEFVPSKEAVYARQADPYPVLKRRLQYCRDVQELPVSERVALLRRAHALFADVQAEESSGELFRTCCFM